MPTMGTVITIFIWTVIKPSVIIETFLAPPRSIIKIIKRIAIMLFWAIIYVLCHLSVLNTGLKRMKINIL